MNMGMPSITITFSELAKTLPKRSNRGVAGLILKGAIPAKNPFDVTSADDIPLNFAAANREAIELALIGNQTPPQKVVVYCLPTSAENYAEALDYFELSKVNYLAVPGISSEGELAEISTWVKAIRQEGKTIKVVLPGYAGDDIGIINFTTDQLVAGEKQYTTAQYCARIAGLCAGTTVSGSITYAALPELTGCEKRTKEEMNAAILAGELIAFYDGEKVKIARGVNSLKTLGDGQGNQFKKIKIVDMMDTIASDITLNIEDNYIGKFTNSYDNKCILVGAIRDYLKSLMDQQLIASQMVDIDVTANKAYLEEQGINTADMTDEEIRQAQTGEKVFAKAVVKILDAIEDVIIPITV